MLPLTTCKIPSDTTGPVADAERMYPVNTPVSFPVSVSVIVSKSPPVAMNVTGTVCLLSEL